MQFVSILSRNGNEILSAIRNKLGKSIILHIKCLFLVTCTIWMIDFSLDFIPCGGRMQL